MPRKVTVFTGTRAEYGLLHSLMSEIRTSRELDLQVLVSAMHLSPEFGETYKQILEDGFTIDAKVEMLLSSDSSVGICKSMGLGTIGYADALDRLRPDAIVILGDRFEALALAQTALVMRIPVVHIHGGEITEGAYDDAIRHAISKMSCLHFTAMEGYRQRVIQMGESPQSVFNVGSLGIERLLRTRLMSADELSSSLSFPLRQPYFLATYHPATNADEDPKQSASEMLQALDCFPNHQIILTYPNADNGGRYIASLFADHAKNNPQRVVAVPSLGSERYFAALSRAAAVVGNSSSGIIEAPSAQVPTVNIGLRQHGRAAADSVLNCQPKRKDIQRTIEAAIDPTFAHACKNTQNPYARPDTSKTIVRILEEYNFDTSKHFYDIAIPS